MSEMLANHYFLFRKFSTAKSIFEQLLYKEPTNKAVKKKLIICYITDRELEKALSLFVEIMEQDLDFLINSDYQSEDCPCRELIVKVESKEIEFTNESEKTIALGILWSYCSIEKSIDTFRAKELLHLGDKRIEEIRRKLTAKVLKRKNKIIN